MYMCHSRFRSPGEGRDYFSWNNLREYIGKNDDLHLSQFNEEVKIPRTDTTSKGDVYFLSLFILRALV